MYMIIYKHADIWKGAVVSHPSTKNSWNKHIGHVKRIERDELLKNDLRLTISTYRNNVGVDTFNKHKKYENGKNLNKNYWNLQ